MKDMIDIGNIEIINSQNVLPWPITTNLSQLDVGILGINPTFDKEDTWPNVVPKGWDGPITHTLWLFMNIGGWIGSGIIQYYRGLTNSGGAIWRDEQIAKNWVYDGRWGRMHGHQPSPGELIGFMVAAGNQRGQFDQSIQERSNIVTLAMPSGPQVFDFVDSPIPNPTIPPAIPPPTTIPSDKLDLVALDVKEILRILQPFKKN